MVTRLVSPTSTASNADSTAKYAPYISPMMIPAIAARMR